MQPKIGDGERIRDRDRGIGDWCPAEQIWERGHGKMILGLESVYVFVLKNGLFWA